MHNVTFRDGLYEPVADHQTAAIVFSYADNRNHAVYLDVPLDEAKRRFTERMNDRHPFEIEREGWEVSVSITPVSDELWIMGSAGADLLDFSNLLMGRLKD